MFFTKIKEIIYLLVVRIPTIVYGKYMKRNLVKVHWGRDLHNFGDCLQPDTLRYYGLIPVYVTSLNKSEIVLAGSILQWLTPDYNGTIIGTGGDAKDYKFPNAKVIAVRGLKTARLLPPPITCYKLGDCGLLCRLVYPNKEQKRYRIGIVPHFCDLKNEAVNRLAEKYSEKITLISPLEKPAKVVKKIKQCGVILSSSLHGLIVADAFAIPTRRWVDRCTMPDENFYDYKFLDYYSSIGVEEAPVTLTGKENITELESMTTLKPQDVIGRLIAGLDRAMQQFAMQQCRKL